MNLGLEANTSMNASRHYNIVGQNKNKTSQQLSSGYRINSAADDAAGLSISEKMRQQIRGLGKSEQNINDGTSYVQVADGALSEVQSMLHRLNELSIQAANATNTDADRTAINKEVQSLKTEINRIFADTEYNTKKIWTTDTDNKILIGVEPVPAVEETMASSQSFKITDTNKWAVPYSSYKVTATADDGIKVSWTAYNGNTYSTSNIPWPEPTIGSSINFSLKDYLDTATYPELEGIDFKVSYQVSEYATMDDVIASLNNTYFSNSTSEPVSVTIKTDAGDGLSSISAPGVSISFSGYINYAAQLAADRKFDYSSDTAFIEPLNGNTDNFHMNAAGGWYAEFDLGTDIVNPLASPFTGTDTSNSTYYYASTSEPDKFWWSQDSHGYKYTTSHTIAPSNGTLDSIYAAVTDSPSQLTLPDTKYGGTIRVDFPLTGNYSIPGHSYTGIGSTSMYISVTPTTTGAQIEDLIKQIKGIDIKASGNGYSYTYDPSLKDVKVDSPIYEAQIALNIQTSDNAYDHIAIAYKSLRLQNIGLADTNTLTEADAQKSISDVAKALDIVSEQRSLFGAYQNQLSSAHAVSGLSAENVQSAESRIRDTDVAKAMVAFSSYSILQQSGEAVIAQSNTNMQKVLSLLQF